MADVDKWTYDTVAGATVTYERPKGKGSKGRRIPSGIEGPYLPLDYGNLDPDRSIVITEGERDRDAVLNSTDHQASCWIGGCNSWDKTDWEVFRDRKIILWPDRDDPGYDAMSELADRLFDLGCDIDIVPVPEGDTDGWGAADCQPGQAQELIDNAITVPNPCMADITPGTLPDEADCFPAWQPISGLMECGATAIWHGPPKGGKSAFAMLVGAQLLTGQSLVGIPSQDAPRKQDSREHKLLMIWLEEHKATADLRRWAICKHHDLFEDIWDRSSWVYSLPQGEIDDRLRAIRKYAAAVKPSVVMIDNLARLDPLAESNSEDSTKLIAGLEAIARDRNCAMVLVHHNRKMPGQDSGKNAGDEMMRGSSALTGAARVMLEIKSEGRNFIAVDGGGTNNSESAEGQRFRKNSVEVNTFPTVALSLEAKPDLFEGISKDQAKLMHGHLLAKPPELRRNDIRSTKGWAGYVLGEYLKLEMGENKKVRECTDEEVGNRGRIKSILEVWTKTGMLAVDTASWHDPGQRRDISGNVYIRGKTEWKS